ncbi:MAG: hypothetical protein ABIP46_05785, partial [Polaromonas sp.]
PLPGGLLGHDYSVVATGWMDGHIWFSNNGLSVPWFTPSFCAGQPFFPDPQSAYYSLPQFLDIAAGPVAAAYLTLCILASLMFWGGYLLARKVFATGQLVAVLVGGLLMFNGFLPHRLIIGHMAFHGFALTPWLALLLLVPLRSPVNQAAAALAAGLVLAYWVQSGFGTLILAGALGVFLLAMLHCLRGGSFKSFLGRSALAGVVGLALSAAKLTATFSYLANFPRTFYLLPGADSLPDAFAVVAGALFLPSEWAVGFGMPKMANLQFVLGAHEWAFNFSLAAALLIVFLVVGLARSGGAWARPGLRQGLLLAALLAGLAWPLAFNYFNPTWNAFLKTVPVINTASTPLRWIIVYIPILAIGIGLLAERAGWKRWGGLIVGACLLATVAQTALEPRDFYEAQGYDSRPVVLAEQLLRSGGFRAGITILGTGAEIKPGAERMQLTSNNTFVAGMSQVFCYNPVFGYQLEKFSAANLVRGPVLAETNGFLNLKNPACYVYPEENNCKPGDLFRASQLEEAKKFAAYKPFDFKISSAQRSANLVTKIALGLVAWALLGWLLLTLQARRQRRQAGTVK